MAQEQNSIEPAGYWQAQTSVQEFEPNQNEQQDVSTMNPFLLDQDEVIVRQVPEKLNSAEGQNFFYQVQKLLSATQPRFVFDFTHVRELDVAGIDLLLQCLEEVMKLNGDVKLAAVRRGPAAILELTRVDSLFEIFDSTAEAVESFYPFPRLDETIQASLQVSQAPSGGETVSYGAD
jgi:anti-anti-sigma factor